MSAISLANLSRTYGSVPVLHNIDLEIHDGELMVFVGPSGCGKSTLLRHIAGLDQPSGGTIFIDGKDVTKIPAADRGLAMVFQSYALYPHMSVRQNLSFGLENAKLPKAEISARIGEAARMLEITPYLDRRPGQLSGGQRQRVAIGRAIVRHPTAFLLDEPLSNLDAELRISTRAELAALHKRLSTTMIYVTHDQTEAMTLADRIVVLRAGRIEQVGTPLELYNQPGNLFVAGFIGAPRMNFLPVESLPALGFVKENEVAGRQNAMTIGIRPQHIRLASGDESGLETQIILIEALGSETVIHTRTKDGQSLLVVMPGQWPLKTGDIVSLRLDPAKWHLFDGSGNRVETHAFAV